MYNWLWDNLTISSKNNANATKRVKVSYETLERMHNAFKFINPETKIRKENYIHEIKLLSRNGKNTPDYGLTYLTGYGYDMVWDLLNCQDNQDLLNAYESIDHYLNLEDSKKDLQDYEKFVGSNVFNNFVATFKKHVKDLEHQNEL